MTDNDETENESEDTDTDTAVEVETEEELVELADADFAKGAESVQRQGQPGATSEEDAAPASDEKKEETEAAASIEQEQPVTKPVEEPEPKPWEKGLSDISDRLRGLEGNIGGVMEKLNGKPAAADTATGGTGTDTLTQRVDAQLKHMKEIEGTVENFEDMKPFMDELLSIREDLAKQGGGGVTLEDLDARIEASRNEGRQLAYLDTNQPDWEKKAATPEFKAYILDGGPPAEQYNAYRVKLKTGQQGDQAAMGEALKMETQFESDHPTWWKAKGTHLFSDLATDSVQMLNNFDTHVKNAKQRQDQTTRNKKRLSAASEPNTAGGSDTTAGKSDEEAFLGGHSKVSKQRM